MPGKKPDSITQIPEINDSRFLILSFKQRTARVACKNGCQAQGRYES